MDKTLNQLAHEKIMNGCAYKRCDKKSGGVYAFKNHLNEAILISICLDHKRIIDADLCLHNKAKWFGISWKEIKLYTFA